MKEYLKMSDFIIGNVSMSMNHNGDVSVQYDYADPDMIVRKTMGAMEHAINSHDELVAEVERLRGALLQCVNGLYIAHKFCGDHTAEECGDEIAIPIGDALVAASKLVAP